MKTKNLLSYLIVVFLLMVSISSNAQAGEVPEKFKTEFELKINPIFALFGLFQVEAEFVLSESFGLATEVIAGEGGGGAVLHGKYYFNPDLGGDKFYFGAFAGGGFGDGDFAGAAFGFDFGHKWIGGNEKVLFEIAGGVGRTTGGGVLPYAKLDVGYRF